VDFLSLGDSRRSLVTVPLYDYYGYIQILSHILCGAGWIGGESIAFADGLIKRLAAGDVTDLVLVPYSLRRLLSAPPEKSRSALRAICCIASSSDILTDDLLEALFEVNSDLAVFNVYGLVEAGRASCRKIVSNTPHKPSIGSPAPGVEVGVEQIDANGRGTIVIRGPTVMLGYSRPITGEDIEFDPCDEVRTGDYGCIDRDGDVILHGRSDHMINVMGSKIHPSEIEVVAMQFDCIEDARARAQTDDCGDVTIELDVVVSNPQLSLDALHNHLRKNLQRFFVPKVVYPVKEIRRTELGSKILRRG
jgi:O-succinylbenzoic acid--CoA ligase